MSRLEQRIAFLGAGNMGEALIKGLLAAGTTNADNIWVADIRTERLEHLARCYGVQSAVDNQSAVTNADIVILAVKPQVLANVLLEIQPRVTSRLLISIAAGINTSFIQEKLRGKGRVIRVMPNTPALVQSGISAVCPGYGLQHGDMELAKSILAGVGEVVLVEEKLLDAITALSGSGPAYIFMIVEALADAGVLVGLSRELALKLTIHTVLGTVKMLLETGVPPSQLKDMVTSPGGTTIAGIQQLEQGRLRATIMAAVQAATNRAQELGNG